MGYQLTIIASSEVAALLEVLAQDSGAFGQIKIVSDFEPADSQLSSDSDVFLFESSGSGPTWDVLSELRKSAPHAAIIAIVTDHQTERDCNWMRTGVSACLGLAELDAITLGRQVRQALARRSIDVTLEARVADLQSELERVEGSERRFRELFEHSVGLICTHDLEGILLSINPTAALTLGYQVTDLVGRPMLDLVPPALVDHFREYLKRITRTGDDSGVLYILHRDGTPLIWEYHNRVVRDAAGKPYVIGHAKDITQRRLDEHRLLEQQAEIEAVNDGSPLGLFRADHDGNFTYTNQSFERITGQRGDESAGSRWSDALHPEDRSRVVEVWSSATQRRSPFRSTHRLQLESSRTVWVSMLAASLIVEGKFVGYVGSVEDITARHLTEQKLRYSELRLRTIADAMPAMIGYIDITQRFAFVNAAYERTFKRDRSDIIGRSVIEVLGGATYAKRRPYLERALRGERLTFEDESQAGEHYQCMDVTYIPQRDEQNSEVLGVHAMVQDITARKLKERGLMQAAEIDGLTGLTNRAGFLIRLDQALARSRTRKSMLAVLYLDIDHFKHINDTFGHGVGDAILKAFAERLSALQRASDVIARLGGDEFTIIMEGARRPQYASLAAAKIVASMRRPFVLAEELVTISLTVSVGLTVSAQELPVTGAALLERADDALYDAKAAGRDCYRTGASALRLANA